MKIICKNCTHAFEGNFCNKCGQTAETHKINFHFLWHDIQHSLLHFDDGIPYSVKQLFTRPGHSIREFIEGKRVRHFKPVSLVVVLATLYGVLHHFFNVHLYQNISNNLTLGMDNYNEWLTTHFSWITIATIPLFTIGTYICFRKQGYNFVEYFVLNSYKASQRLVLHILAFPLFYYFNGSSKTNNINEILYIFDVLLMVWTNIQFFNKLSPIKTLLLTLLSHMIFLMMLILIIISFLVLNGFKIT